MEAVNTTFKVQSILFESNDTEVIMRGTTMKGTLQYESEYILSHTQLNQVINTLQRQNAEATVYEMITSERMYDDNLLYTGSFEGLSDATINIAQLASNHQMKQIRA